MSTNLKRLLSLCSLACVIACSATNGQDDWSIKETAEPERSDPTIRDCPESDWENDDFAFVLYREIACRRGDGENILFSPAAIRVALGEWAHNQGGPEGEALAEEFGYESSHEMFVNGQAYRDELLARRLTPYERYDSRAEGELAEVEFEEEGAERLRRALSIEFFGVDCDGESVGGCTWSPQNDRWDDDVTFLDDEIASAIGESEISTHGMVFRGQWETEKRATQWVAPFMTDSGEDIVEIELLAWIGDNFVQWEDIELFEWRLLGGEVSVLFVGASEHPIREIESTFLSRPLAEWIAPLEVPSSPGYPPLLIPMFDVAETVDVAKTLNLEEPVLSSTTMSLFKDKTSPDIGGVNLPDSVTTKLVAGDERRRIGWGNMSVDPDIRRTRRFDTPFLFVVYDRPTESVLKMGRISHP